MKNTLKIVSAVLGLLCAATGAPGQGSQVPGMKFLPLISGYNVLVPTNATVGLGVTNVLYTTKNGQIWYSYNNYTNGAFTGVTNGAGLPNADAFAVVSLQPDMVGGFASTNTYLFVYSGNSNWIPNVQLSNSASFTANCISTNWPIGYPSGGGVNYWTVGTNTYPTGLYLPNTTNTLTVNLWRGPSLYPNGAGSADPSSAGPPKYPMWEGGTPGAGLSVGVPAFTCSINTTNQNGWGVYVALPPAFVAGAANIYATITAQPMTATAGSNVLVNMIGILQPQRP